MSRVLVGKPGDAAEREADRLADAAVCGRGRSHVTRRGPEEAGAETVPGVGARLRSLQGRGLPLPGSLRADLGARFGHDFSRVRVHTDSAADEAARGLGAVAFALGRDVAFASGRYEPRTEAGRRLIAHELVHVAQHGDGPAWVARASYGVQGPNPRGILEQESQKAAPEEELLPVVRRQPQTGGGSGSGSGSGTGTGPTLATPTISLSPGPALTRGDTLTATIGFTPNAGETLTVRQWRYATAAHGTVARPSSDLGFQTSWSGVMATTGQVSVVYTITPAGGSVGAAQMVPARVTVNDRTGTPWVSAVTLDPEGTFTGQPSPPQQFRQLGRHNVPTATLPTIAQTTIAGGPNAAFTYISSLTAGTYASSPLINPDASSATSAFWRFHLDPSRLYIVLTSGTRTLIPLTEYSALTVAAGAVTFTVPDWEAFLKLHNVYRVTAKALGSGGTEIVLPNAEWTLDSNARTARVRAANPARVRSRLGIGAGDGFGVAVTALGRWEGFQLLEAPAILAGTRSHEYQHAVHSHRANFLKMMRALDPQRKLETTVASPSAPVNYGTTVNGWWREINRPVHELVDEAASRAAERFVPAAGSMAACNQDPATGAFLGSVWDITNDRQMA